MTITPPELEAMYARDRDFGDGESEDASDIAQDRHALLDHCAALQAALSEALDEFEDALPYVGDYYRRKWGYDETLGRLRALAAGGAPAAASAKDPDR